MKENATMKTIKQVTSGTRIPCAAKACYYNVLAIDHDGSPISTQVWSADGNPNGAGAVLLGWYAEGVNQYDNWHLPLVAAYVHCAADGKTYRFDMTDPVDRGLLSSAA